MVRRAVLAAAWVVLAGVAVFVAARILGFTDTQPKLFALATLTAWLLVPCAAIAIVAAVLRARTVAVVATMLLVTVGAWVAPDLRWWSTAAAIEGPVTVIAASNVGPDHTSVQAMAADVLAIDADVLNILELTPGDQVALRAAGIEEKYPYSIEDPQTGAHGSGIYSRYPIRNGDVLYVDGTPMARAIIELPSGPTTVVAVHTTQPLAGPRFLNVELQQLQQHVEQIDGPVILAGDFNATRQHQAFRELLESGFRDAHLEAGRGWSATWPMGRRLPPFALIDRVVVSDGLTASSVAEVKISGSDHRAVVATIGATSP